MSYLDKLTCQRDTCAKEETIPIKLIVKGSSVLNVARCPNCRKSYKILLPLNAKDEWLPIIAEKFFSCDVCGTNNQDNWQYAGSGSGFGMWHPYWYWRNVQERLKIKFRCKSCGKGRAKVVSADLWSDISKAIEKPPEKPEPALKCPHCNADISADVKICPNCNKEIACDKCGSPIPPGAKFCSTCGDPVEELGIPAIDIPKNRICPTCQEDYDEGTIFCNVCGQELICDKCGEAIQEGALFCVNCGDPVTKGELSE